MCTHDLIVLAGRSGTGKTSFCRLFAQAIDAKFTVIPVKPNWLSSEDLLGYFNPINDKYYYTPFLQAIIAANKDPSRLHLVVLDEMNIARPEYYFADFLSSLENRSSDDVYIQLPVSDSQEEFSNNLNELSTVLLSLTKNKTQTLNLNELLEDHHARDELRNTLKCNNDEIENKLLNIAKQTHNKNAYTAKIKIPENIRFIGTINIDETTHYFSPKVLDRVHVLKLDDPIEVPPEKLCKGSGDSKLISPSLFCSRTEYPQYDSKQPLSELLQSIKQDCRKLGADISLRLIRQAMHFKNKASELGIPDEEITGIIIRSKIFPRLVFDAADVYGEIQSKKRSALVKIKEKVKDKVSYECEKEMEGLLQQLEDEEHHVNYWSL